MKSFLLLVIYCYLSNAQLTSIPPNTLYYFPNVTGSISFSIPLNASKELFVTHNSPTLSQPMIMYASDIAVPNATFYNWTNKGSVMETLYSIGGVVHTLHVVSNTSLDVVWVTIEIFDTYHQLFVSVEEISSPPVGPFFLAYGQRKFWEIPNVNRVGLSFIDFQLCSILSNSSLIYRWGIVIDDERFPWTNTTSVFNDDNLPVVDRYRSFNVLGESSSIIFGSSSTPFRNLLYVEVVPYLNTVPPLPQVGGLVQNYSINASISIEISMSSGYPTWIGTPLQTIQVGQDLWVNLKTPIASSVQIYSTCSAKAQNILKGNPDWVKQMLTYPCYLNQYKDIFHMGSYPVPPKGSLTTTLVLDGFYNNCTYLGSNGTIFLSAIAGKYPFQVTKVNFPQETNYIITPQGLVISPALAISICVVGAFAVIILILLSVRLVYVKKKEGYEKLND